MTKLPILPLMLILVLVSSTASAAHTTTIETTHTIYPGYHYNIPIHIYNPTNETITATISVDSIDTDYTILEINHNTLHIPPLTTRKTHLRVEVNQTETRRGIIRIQVDSESGTTINYLYTTATEIKNYDIEITRTSYQLQTNVLEIHIHDHGNTQTETRLYTIIRQGDNITYQNNTIYIDKGTTRYYIPIRTLEPGRYEITHYIEGTPRYYEYTIDVYPRDYTNIVLWMLIGGGLSMFTVGMLLAHADRDKELAFPKKHKYQNPRMMLEGVAGMKTIPRLILGIAKQERHSPIMKLKTENTGRKHKTPNMAFPKHFSDTKPPHFSRPKMVLKTGGENQ